MDIKSGVKVHHDDVTPACSDSCMYTFYSSKSCLSDRGRDRAMSKQGCLPGH